MLVRTKGIDLNARSFTRYQSSLRYDFANEFVSLLGGEATLENIPESVTVNCNTLRPRSACAYRSTCDVSVTVLLGFKQTAAQVC